MKILTTLLVTADAFIVGLFIGAAMYIVPAVKAVDFVVSPTFDAYGHVTDLTPPPILDGTVKTWSFAFSDPDGITEPYDVQAVMGYRMYQPTNNPQPPYSVGWQFVGVK